MKQPKILVTGAAGRTGAAVVTQLCQESWPVRAVVRRRDQRSDRLRMLGAEVVVADLYDANQLCAAMRGCKRAYYCPPMHPHMIHSAVAFAIAAEEARVEFIAGLSQWLASPAHPSLLSRQHWMADRLFSHLPGIGHTIVNPGFFASSPYMALMKYAALLGVFPMPADGASKNAPPSDEDIARVAVAVLIDPERHAGKTYRPTGPELISIDEMAGILSRVFGRRVRHVRLPLWMFYKAARMDGYDAGQLSGFRHYVLEHNSGAFAFGAPTSDVLDLTGRQAESFETIARRYAASPEMQPTLANRLRALGSFLSVPLRPGFNPARYEREMALPAAAAPLLDMSNEQWKREHAAQVTKSKAVERLHSKVAS